MKRKKLRSQRIGLVTYFPSSTLPSLPLPASLVSCGYHKTVTVPSYVPFPVTYNEPLPMIPTVDHANTRNSSILPTVTRPSTTVLRPHLGLFSSLPALLAFSLARVRILRIIFFDFFFFSLFTRSDRVRWGTWMVWGFPAAFELLYSWRLKVGWQNWRSFEFERLATQRGPVCI